MCAQPALTRLRAGCPFCKDVGKCIGICRNPQNVGNPEAGPTADVSAPSAVATQLNALMNNHTPRLNHGLSVARPPGGHGCVAQSADER